MPKSKKNKFGRTQCPPIRIGLILKFVRKFGKRLDFHLPKRTVGDAGPYNFCKNTPFEHDVKPYIIELKVFCPSFFQKRGRGLGRRPIKPSNPSSDVFVLNAIDIKSFWLHLFSKRWTGLGAAPHKKHKRGLGRSPIIQ